MRSTLDDDNLKEYKEKLNELEKENKKQRFKLRPKTFYCTFKIEDIQKNLPFPLGMKTTARVTIRQLPVILNDATTGHKLQGMSKNQIIIQSWSYQNSGWVYTVLSRVRTMDGLFICERLDYRKYVKSTRKNASALKAFDERMRRKIPPRAL